MARSRAHEALPCKDMVLLGADWVHLERQKAIRSSTERWAWHVRRSLRESDEDGRRGGGAPAALLCPQWYVCR